MTPSVALGLTADRCRHHRRVAGGGGRDDRLPRDRVALAAGGRPGGSSSRVAGGGSPTAGTTQSGYFALPARQRPPGRQRRPRAGRASRRPTASGFYFVDVNELQANLIQKLWAEHLVEGAAAGARQPDPRAGPVQPAAHHRGLRGDDQLPADRAGGSRARARASRCRSRSWAPSCCGDPARVTRPPRPASSPGDIVTDANGTAVALGGRPDRRHAAVKPGQAVQLTLTQAGDVTLRRPSPAPTSPAAR